MTQETTKDKTKTLVDRIDNKIKTCFRVFQAIIKKGFKDDMRSELIEVLDERDNK